MAIRPQFLVLLLIVCAVIIIGIRFNICHYAQSENLATAVDLVSFSGALVWVKSASYLLIFIAMIIEGPVITATAAFAAALGYFNIWIVFVLAISGDLVGDFIYYGIGYFGRIAFVEKYGYKVGLTKQRTERLEHLIKMHPRKTLVAIKLAPFFPTPGLMMIGATRMSFGKFSEMAFVITLPKVVLFMALGYYFGSAYNTVSSTLQSGEYFIVVALVVTVFVFYLYKKLAAKLSTRLEVI